MARLTIAAGVVMALLSGAHSHAQELQDPSLAGLSHLSAVIVTVASDTVAEDKVRAAVNRRLAQSKISVESGSGPELLVSVSADRNRADTQACEFGRFSVTFQLRELVTLERAPEQGPVTVITWRTGGEIRRFSSRAPALGLMDLVEDGMSSFLRQVASDTHQATGEKARR
jgi:hypothetical protein